MKKLLVLLAIVLTAFLATACQQQTAKPTKPVAKTSRGELTLDQIGEVQPGLGQIMMRVGPRITTAYYAAQGNEWDLVDYELEELAEDLEVGTITRPKHKAGLEKFLGGSAWDDLKQAAKDKDRAAFNTAFKDTVKACNNCHKSEDVPFITYVLPDTPPDLPPVGK